MPTDLSRLAAAVSAAPGDVALRLVYADALDDAGQGPEAEQQRQLAALCAFAPRAGEMIQAAFRLIGRHLTDMAQAWPLAGETLTAGLQLPLERPDRR